MSAVLFGSISTLADTSELQRQAFNDAFAEHGLGWTWDREAYRATLDRSGGQDRIAEYAASRGQLVDAAAVHRSKSALFQRSLATAGIAPRPGVVDTIHAARQDGFKLALVTTTSAANVAALLRALGPALTPADFDTIIDSSVVDAPKPDRAAYDRALADLGESPQDCVAIEDNVGGLASAVGAGVACVAFPNDNTAGHDFAHAAARVDHLDFAALRALAAAS